jgi:RHS repeat-associated protein
MLAVNASDGVRFWFGESETRYDLSGAQTKRYIHLSGGGPTLARVEDGSTIELQYADALQNLMFSLDAAGNVVASFLYGAFGEVVHSEGDADHRRQFNGKENDVVSGLRYYGFRYYDPVTLRWNSADPLYRFAPDVTLVQPQRINLYAFSLNNGLRYFDPDGREPADRLRRPQPKVLARLRSNLSNAKASKGQTDVKTHEAAIGAVIQQTIKAFRIDTSSMQSIQFDGGHETFMAYTRNQDVVIGPGSLNSVAELASAILHEAVHAERNEELANSGVKRSGMSLWGNEQWKAITEVEAYQAEIDSAKTLGTSKEFVKGAEKLRDGYLDQLPPGLRKKAQEGKYGEVRRLIIEQELKRMKEKEMRKD